MANHVISVVDAVVAHAGVRQHLHTHFGEHDATRLMFNLDTKYNMLYSLQVDNDYEFVYRSPSVFMRDPLYGCHHCEQPRAEVYVYVHNRDDPTAQTSSSSSELHVAVLASRGAKRMHHRLLCAHQFKKFVMRLPRHTNVQNVKEQLQAVFHKVTATPCVDRPSLYEICVNGSPRRSFVYDVSTTTLSTAELPVNAPLPMRPCASKLLSCPFPQLRPTGSARSRFFM